MYQPSGFPPLADNINYLTILVGGVTTTLPTTANELLSPGTVQVAVNAETSVAFPSPKAATQTQLSIPNHTPGAY